LNMGNSRNIKFIVVHCADTPEGRNVSTDEIKRWHMEERGWSDIGYHYVIELDGKIAEGRSEEVAGAHARGYNTSSIGVCYVGGADKNGNPKDTRTAKQKESLEILLEGLLVNYPDAQIVGHRDLDDGKACPSFDAKTEYEAF
jgi:N-acetylmuramoyl-L-alanine amidase